eukprot:Hpha_TRINITY_DN20761_c0_g1::TRINITY_DN20761_c0_g1_i1::g.33434::m.33434
MDPFHAVQDVKKHLQQAEDTARQWRSGSPGDGEDAAEHRILLKMQLQKYVRSAEWELQDLIETIQIAGEAGGMGVSPEELEKHRAFVASAKETITNLAREVEAEDELAVCCSPESLMSANQDVADGGLLHRSQRVCYHIATGVWLASTALMQKGAEGREEFPWTNLSHVVDCGSHPGEWGDRCVVHRPAKGAELTLLVLTEYTEFIESALASGRLCLLFGDGRAGAIAAAYLMRSRRISLSEAQASLRNTLPSGCEFDSHSVALRRWESDLTVHGYGHHSPTAGGPSGLRNSVDDIEFLADSTDRISVGPAASGQVYNSAGLMALSVMMAGLVLLL